VAVRSAASPPDSDQVGGADDISYFIKRVTFKLHDTYPNPSRSEFMLPSANFPFLNPHSDVDKPPFELTETGHVSVVYLPLFSINSLSCRWGEFEIQIRITFVQESGEKAVTVYHHLKLHPWAAVGEPEIPPLDIAVKMGPVHAWQYDEVVFNDPYQNFLNLLTQHPPTPLPKLKRKPVPFHPANFKEVEASRGGVPEFHAGMEKEESDRLEEARKTIIAEQDHWRGILIEREKEIQRLQREVDELS